MPQLSQFMYFIVPGIICFLIRFLPRVIYKNAISSDTYFHLDVATRIRQNKYKIPSEIKNYLAPHKHLYPHMYHVLLALFPYKSRLVFERHSAALFETLNVVMTCLFLKYFVALQFDFLTDFWILMIGISISISPGLLRTSGGPRAYNGSPRIMGQFLFLLHTYSFLIFLPSDNYWFAAISTFSVAILVVTAKFGMQVIAFFMIGFSVLDWKYIPLLAAGILISAIITRGQALKIIAANVAHSHHYFFIQKALLYSSHKTIRDYPKALYYFLANIKNGKFNYALNWLFSEKFSLHLLLLIYPYYVIIFALLWANPINSNFEYAAVILVASSVGTFILTRNKPFLFVGEAARYLEYLLPIMVSFSAFLALKSDHPWMIYAYIAYSALLMLYFVFGVRTFLSRMQDEYDQFSAFTDHLVTGDTGTKKRVLPNPFYLCKNLVQRFDCEVLAYYPGNVDRKLFPKEETEFIYFEGGQTVSAGILEVMEKYELEFFFTEKPAYREYVESVFEGKEERFLKYFKLEEETERYLLFSLKPRSSDV
jgi:hypothetical protein